ncbi:MAG: UvrD-helicase domain-containing protein [Gammaproteobacteria bacterium]
MTDFQPNDAKARQAALNPQTSFVVQAPAGSGKTGLLIQRTLALLARVKQPEEVVAITFTRKAAAEMRERLLEALAAAAQPAPEAAYEKVTWTLARAVLAHDEQHEWFLTLNPARLRIMTIDAFCASLVGQMPILSRFGASHEVLQSPFALYRRAARRLLGSLEDDGIMGESLNTLLRHLDNHQERVEDLLVDMLAHRDRWLPLVSGAARPDLTREALEATLQLCVEQGLERAAATLPAAATDAFIDVLRNAAQALDPDHALAPCRTLDAIPVARLEHLAVWRAIAGFFLTKNSGEVRKKLTAKDGILAPSSTRDKDEKARRQQRKEEALALFATVRETPAFCAALRALLELPPIRYDNKDWQILEVLQPVLPMAAAELKVLFQERGQIDFTEQAHRALMALGTEEAPTDLALALDYRIGHLLVDEFQDTSRTQFEMLERLVSGWAPGDGRSLFLVGDPMQSIYRFRDAEVGLFLQAQQHGLGDVKLEALSLSANFRTRSTLVERSNTVFDQLFPPQGDATNGTVTFAPAQAARSAGGDGLVCHAFVDDDGTQQAERVVDRVRDALAQDTQSSVAILVRSRSHLRDILPRLSDAGIPFHAVDILPLANSPVVIDLWSLTRAMLHLGDRTAWLSILRAPWCGLTLEDLHALAGASVRFSLWELIINDERHAPLSDDGKVRLARVKAVLAQAMGARGRQDLRRWVEGAWTALGGPACLTSANEMNNALSYFDLLETLDEAGGLENLDDLTKGVERLYADAASDIDARLQIMTIHKAKGLEFDTVIVPSLERRTPPNARALLQWVEFSDRDGAPRRLLAPIQAAGNDGEIGKYVGRIQAARDHAEALRLLYVATTRARESLHLMISVKQTDDDELKAPSGSALGALLWPALDADFAAARVEAPTSSAQDDPDATNVHHLKRVPSQWLLPRAPQPKPWVGSEMVLPAETQREANWAGDSARHVGTTVHRILQQIAQEGIDPWIGRWMDILDPYATRMLANLGVRNEELPGASERVSRAIRLCLEDERGRWLLGPHKKDRAEMPMSAWVDGRVRNVVLDRTFVDIGGTRWIVDYKTSQHDVGSDEAFMDAQCEVYREQLEMYARVMQRIDTSPIKLALYFPLLQGWREWDFRG